MAGHSDLCIPETEAVTFYFSNHAASVVASQFDQHEPLRKEVADIVRGYAKLSSDMVVRLTYYVLLIITREARHKYPNDAFDTHLLESYGPEFMKFHKAIVGKGSSGAASALRNNPPDLTIGSYVTGLTDLFNNGSFSSGYGGKPWGNVAETLRKLLHGEISAETFGDTAFTLAHNNGPIFNKGMLYQQQGGDFIKLLDVQRSGQIPQFFDAFGYHTSALNAYRDNAIAVYPEELTGYVDWFKVEALGAVHTYTQEKVKQVQKYGPSLYEAELAKVQGTKFRFGLGIEDVAHVFQREAA